MAGSITQLYYYYYIIMAGGVSWTRNFYVCIEKKKKRGIVDMVSQWHVTRKNYLTFNNGGNKSDDCL